LKSRVAVWSVLVGVSLLTSLACVLYASRAALIVFGILFAGAILRFPTVGFVLMMGSFLIQASPIYQQYGFLASTYTATDLLGLLVVSGVLVQHAASGRNSTKRSWSPVHTKLMIAIAAYFSWSILAFMWSPVALDVSSQYIRHVTENIFVFGLALLILNSREAVRRAAGVYAFAGTALAIYTIVDFQRLNGFAVSGNTFAGQAVYRSGGVGAYNENSLAIMLAVVPALAYLASEALPRRLQLLLTGLTIPIVGLALIILTSREVFVAIAIATAAAFVLSRNLRYRLGVGLFVVLAGATFLIASQTNHIPWYFSQRFSAASYDNFGSRLPGWMAGLQLFAQNPLAGVGNGGFQTYITSYHINYTFVTSPHSDYIGTLADTGLVGFILLLTMLTVLGSTIVFRAGRNPANVIVFFVIVVSMAAGSNLEDHWLWVTFGIVTAYGLAMSTGVEREEERTRDHVAARLPLSPSTATLNRA
jgi:O-antigen ligase